MVCTIVSMMQRSVSVFLLTLALLSWTTHQASAYLDPGTGSYFFQLALGGIFAALFAIKLFWSQIKLFVLKLRHRQPSQQT